MRKRKTAVAGAGAGGMMAAISAARSGSDVTVFERNREPGRKLLITGKGRCNITNNSDISDLIANIPGNGSFLYSTLNTFGSREIIDFFESNGVRLVTERGGRVFPASGEASDIADALYRCARAENAEFRFESRVKDVVIANRKVEGILLEDGRECAYDALIIATGGASYPCTGSTGDGYGIAAGLGHAIIPPKPSLVPLAVSEKWVSELQGLSLRNVSVDFFDGNGSKVYKDFGEMLFTHYGISGPIILSGSAHLARRGYKGARVAIDLKPALSPEKLDARLQRDFIAFSRRRFINSLDELLPQKLIPVICFLSGIDPQKQANQITKEERSRLCGLLKGFELDITDSAGFGEAIVTAGGVSVSEINPGTMESKIIKGLYFAGEVIDTDGYSGGYNLTIAFSTGYTAGSNC